MLSKIEYNIPLNEKKNFIIKKSDWNYSIDIIFTDNLNFYILNLFFILRAYIKSNDSFLEYIYLGINSEGGKEIFTYKKINFIKFDNFDFFLFLSWINNILNPEKEYINNSNFFGFKLIFASYSKIFETNKIYPVYPWKDPYYELIQNFKETKYIDI